MRLFEREMDITMGGEKGLSPYVRALILDQLLPNEIPVRFVVTKSDNQSWHCEVGVLVGVDDSPCTRPTSIFEFVLRKVENTDKFNAVLLVPTGIGAEIGGHSGDAGPVARLLASACDTLITHPNVVNGADINELPENGLYVEGSVISRLLMGTVGLQKVRSNRVLLVIDEHEDRRISEMTINAASAARATLGLDCPLVVKMEAPIRMRSVYSSSGRAVGRVEGLERLCEVLSRHRPVFDAIALASVVDVPEHFHKDYFKSHGEMVNPWGGVEAILSHAISMIFNVPTAHAPMVESMEILNIDPGIVDPRISAEAVSTTFLHSVLKGLHRSPGIMCEMNGFGHSGMLSVADISCLIIPDGCIGLPTLAALEQGIPIIAVRENRNQMQNDLEAMPFAPGKLFVVDNYLEAVGVMTALKAGVAVPAVKRPLAETAVLREL